MANYPADKKLAFLTFDEGPNAKITPKDLDVLEANDSHATFFCVTKGLPEAPGMPARAIADYDQALGAKRGVLGPDYTPGAFRYPGGHLSWKGLEGADDALAAKGAYWIDWNAMTGDAEPPKTHPNSPNGMVQLVAKEAQGANNVVVVLMHDAEDKSMTTKALPGVIKYFRDNGYTLGIID